MSIYERIVTIHGEKTLRKSALRIRGGAGVFEQVMSGKGFRTALEIGTFRGCAAAEMSQYCDKVVTLDLVFGKLERHDVAWDRYAFWESLGVHNIEFRAVKDDMEKQALVRKLKFDFAFIDGGHDSFSVKSDFEMVKHCGCVLFHDADDNGPDVANYVYDFIKTLPEKQVEFIDIFALWRAP